MVKITNTGESTLLEATGTKEEVYLEMCEIFYRWYKTMLDDFGYSDTFLDGVIAITKDHYKERKE